MKIKSKGTINSYHLLEWEVAFLKMVIEYQNLGNLKGNWQSSLFIDYETIKNGFPHKLNNMYRRIFLEFKK